MNSTKMELADGSVLYRNNEKYLHREDGPAFINSKGEYEWWLNGEKHRKDGPASTVGGKVEYWMGGIKLTEEEFNLINLNEVIPKQKKHKKIKM